MKQQAYELISDEVIKALGDHKLLDAFSQLVGLLYSVNDCDLRAELDDIKQAYNMMLGFMKKGMPDPDRGVMYVRLIQQCYSLADRLLRLSKQADSSNPYYEALRTHSKLASLSIIEELGKRIADLKREETELEGRIPFAKKQDMLLECKLSQFRVIGDLFRVLWI